MSGRAEGRNYVLSRGRTTKYRFGVMASGGHRVDNAAGRGEGESSQLWRSCVRGWRNQGLERITGGRFFCGASQLRRSRDCGKACPARAWRAGRERQGPRAQVGMPRPAGESRGKLVHGGAGKVPGTGGPWLQRVESGGPRAEVAYTAFVRPIGWRGIVHNDVSSRREACRVGSPLDPGPRREGPGTEASGLSPSRGR